MKISRLILPCFLALSLTSCNFNKANITNVYVEIAEKNRSTNTNFSTKDLRAYVEYNGKSKELVSFNRFDIYNLSATYYTPSGDSNKIEEDFLLDQIGTYTIEVSYVPSTRFQFPAVGSETFEVVKKIIPATSLTLSTDSMSLSKGESGTISYSILPENSTT